MANGCYDGLCSALPVPLVQCLMVTSLVNLSRFLSNSDLAFLAIFALLRVRSNNILSPLSLLPHMIFPIPVVVP